MNKLNHPLAYAWQETQGKYSEELAKKILNFEKIQKLKFNSVLDICCGSANLLKIIQSANKRCFGTEIDSEFIEYNKQNFPTMGFYKSENILDIDKFKNFDLITMTGRALNNLSGSYELGQFFELVYKHLNDGGVFIFDFYTANQLKNWNQVIKNQTQNVDQITTVSTDTSSVMTHNFYIKTPNNGSELEYKKVSFTETKNYFNSEEVSSLIKRAKFRYLITTDENFSPIPNVSTSKTAYIIAIKRET